MIVTIIVITIVKIVTVVALFSAPITGSTGCVGADTPALCTSASIAGGRSVAAKASMEDSLEYCNDNIINNNDNFNDNKK